MEAIVGIGVGAAILIITIVVVVVAVLCCRKKDDGSFIRVDGRSGSATTNVWFNKHWTVCCCLDARLWLCFNQLFLSFTRYQSCWSSFYNILVKQKSGPGSRFEARDMDLDQDHGRDHWLWSEHGSWLLIMDVDHDRDPVFDSESRLWSRFRFKGFRVLSTNSNYILVLALQNIFDCYLTLSYSLINFQIPRQIIKEKQAGAELSPTLFISTAID